ncbi:MAG: LppX_LprAFG lipoprotein [Anaerolineae bacterium]|nr:LppX_LprAFG lipoprotein [Anaerolineae bacterium]
MREQILWSVLVPIMIVAISGCQAIGLGPTPTPTVSLPADEIVRRSSEAMLAVESLHFEIELTGKLAYIDRPPTTALKQVTGDLLRPDRVRGLVKVSSFGLISEIGLISVAGDSYVTNPVNQRWEALPPEWGWYFDPSLPFDETYGIPAVAPQIEFEKLAVETLDGAAVYQLEGIAQGRQITWWAAGLITDGDVPVTLWIDTETFLIHQVQMVELASDPKRPTTWRIRFTHYNQPLTIEIPPTG